MFSKRNIFIFSLAIVLFFGFKAADSYFEISKNLEIFSAVYKTVNNDYVDEPKPGELMKVGIDAMLASLDPYTNFYTENQAEDAMIMRSGEYGGIGCQSIKRDDYIIITSVFKGLAADKAGVLIGDKILEVNGKSFVGKNFDDISNALRGAPNTKAILNIERNGTKMNIEISREEIKMKNVTYFGMINSETGYIKLEQFTQGAGAEVKEALINLKSKGAKNMVLDLRDNGGGLLHEAVNIVNVFVGSGQTVVYSKGRAADANKTYKTLDAAADEKIPLVVLVNNRSASASEIVCGAIQDFDRGVVIGVNTFGKGLVQNIKPLVYRTQMKVTIAKYYIPSGRCIQELDYSNKNKDGKAQVLADSLKKKFKTKGGRVVLEGGGVKPDVEIPLKKSSSIANLLTKSYSFFDFATQFKQKNTSIGAIESFKISDQVFEEFKSFVKKQNSLLKNESETQLEKFKDLAKNSNYLQSIQSELEMIQTKLNELKLNEIDSNKEEIKELLKAEIARRYFYEESSILMSFVNDENILKALNLFKNTNEYQSILTVK